MSPRYFLGQMDRCGLTKNDLQWLLAQYGLTSPDELNDDTCLDLIRFVEERRKYGPTLQEAWARYIQGDDA
jgi:hypothetical protein